MTVTEVKKTSVWDKAARRRKDDGPKRTPATPGQVAIRLRDLRRDSGYRIVREAAERAGVNVTLLHKLEKGYPCPAEPDRKLRYSTGIASLAVFYGVALEEILLIEASD